MKTPAFLRAILFLSSLLTLAFAREGLCQSQQEKFSQMVKVWNGFYANPDWAGENFDYYWEVFVEAGDISAYNDTIVQLCKRGIDESENRDCRRTSLSILINMDDSSNHSYIESLINDSLLGVRAAAAAIKWGNWDQCAPVLVRASAYESLGDDPRAVPLIMDGIASPDLKRRFRAAEAMARHHKNSSYIMPVARALILSGVAEGGAIYLLENSGDSADVDILSQAAINGQNAAVSIAAMYSLSGMAERGRPFVRAALERIREYSVDKDIRDRAALILQRLDSLK